MTIRRAWYSTIPFTTVVLALAGLARSLPAVEPVAAFDWSVPDRFGLDELTHWGPDREHKLDVPEPGADGLIDYFTTTDAVATPAGGWLVNFHACASTGDGIRAYRWAIDGEIVGEVSGCDSAAGGFSHRFSEEGAHEVSLTVVDASGATDSVTQRVVVQDFLVVGLGDSMASGEGNPDVPITGLFERYLAITREVDELKGDSAAALEGLRAAQTSLSDAREEARKALEKYNLENEAFEPLRRAWNNWKSCSGIGCIGALAGLTAEAVKFGWGALTDWSVIPGLITDALAPFRSALNAANLAVTNLTQSVAAARSAYDDIQSILAEKDDLLESLTGDLVPMWQSDGESSCHRSAFSGQAQAAIRLERADPRTSVTFVHLACSGNLIPDLTGPGGQIDRLVELVGEREIDAILVSIGGNDIGFSRIVTSCVQQEPCHRDDFIIDPAMDLIISTLCSALGPFAEGCERFLADPDVERSARRAFEENLVELPGKYRELQATFLQKIPNFLPNRVHITDYQNAAEAGDGSYCSFDPLDPFAGTPGITSSEWEWIGEEMAPRLNGVIREAAMEHGWNFAEGLYDAGARRGYCSDERLIVRLQESYFVQGSVEGVAHGNRDGHRVIGEILHASMAADLYTGGELDAPRLPGLAQAFRRADANADGEVDVSDAITSLGVLFLGNGEFPCGAAADANGDALLDISDAITSLGFLFLGNAEIPAPGPLVCGPDPSSTLGCESYRTCSTQ